MPPSTPTSEAEPFSADPEASAADAPPERRPWREWLAAAAVFAVLTVIFFLPVFTQDKTLAAIAGHQTIQWPWAAMPNDVRSDVVQSDQANNVYPIQADMNRALRAGEFPFWSQYSFGGGPTLGTVYGVGFYPPRTIFSLILAPIQAHDLLMLIHVWLAGFATFLLVRRLGYSWLAGVLAGITWMFCPSWFALAILEAATIVAALLPLGLWAMHRAITRRSVPDAILCGVIQAMFVLGGSVQPAVFSFAITCGWGVLLGLQRGPPRALLRQALANSRYVVIAGALGLALCAFVVLPGTAQITDSGRSPVPYSTLEVQDVGLDDMAEIVDPSPPPLTGDSVWTLTFIGIPAALFALIGLFTRRPGTGLARTIVIVFALLVIGTPVTRLAYEFVPGFAYLSPLGRVLPFMMFGVALLTPAGFDSAREWVTARARMPRAGAIIVGVSLVLLAVQAFQVMRYSADVNPDFQPRSQAYLYPRTPLIEALYRSRAAYQQAGDVQRIVPVTNGKPGGQFAAPPLVGEAHRLFDVENIGGYMNVLPERSRVISLVLSGATEQRALEPLIGAYLAFYFAGQMDFDLLERIGVNEIVAGPTVVKTPELDAAARELGAQTVYNGPDGRLLRLPDAARRAFVVDGVETVGTEAEALKRFMDPAFPAKTTLLLDGEDARGVAERTSSGPVDADVRVLPSTSDGRRVEVDSPKAGWLVVLDSWDKGWSATVSGREAEVRRGDFAYRAVQIPAGRSVVEMKYTTPGLRLGIAITLLGLLAIAVLLVAPAVRRRRA